MSERKHDRAITEKLTVDGCVLTTLSFAVTMGSAVTIVLWRDANGHPLPRVIALISPLLIGAAFHGIGSAVLWLLGLPVMTKPEKKRSDWPEL
jgi:hypothetical protein